MKFLLSLIQITLISSFIYPQELHDLEFRINIKNNNSGKLISAYFDLQNADECWEAVLDDVDKHDLKSFICSSRESISNNVIGWMICWKSEGESFGLGKYKLTVYTGSQYSDYFYIDYRTSDLPEAYTANDDIDVFLNADNGILYWDEALTNQVGTDYTIWDLSDNIDLITTELEPYPPTNFQLNSGSSISLTWNSDPLFGEYYWTNYSVYRSVVSGCGSPSGGYTKIATLSASTENFIDYNFSGGGSLLTAYYKITSVNGNRESIYTDPLNICVFPGLDKKNDNDINYANNLSQNFPNPFNPKTSIDYSTEEDNFISIIIYDILGKEVSILFNGYKEAGKYSLNFNAENLPSGIY